MAAVDHHFCSGWIFSHIPQRSREIRPKNRIAAREGRAVASISPPWMAPPRIYGGIRYCPGQYPIHPFCIHSFVLFRPGANAPPLGSQVCHIFAPIKSILLNALLFHLLPSFTGEEGKVRIGLLWE